MSNEQKPTEQYLVFNCMEPTKVASFEAWATQRGHDTAGKWDDERKQHLFFDPFTAELWEAWCAAFGVCGHE